MSIHRLGLCRERPRPFRGCDESLVLGVLGQLAAEDQTSRRLNVPGAHGSVLVVASETASLHREALKEVVHKRIHDSHRLVGDARVGVHLLEHLVDVRRVRVVLALDLALCDL